MSESVYFRVLLEHLKNAPLEDLVTHIEVYHDDWCDVFIGKECNCVPDVASGPAIQRKYEGDAL
jgi:hypothetical protein